MCVTESSDSVRTERSPYFLFSVFMTDCLARACAQHSVSGSALPACLPTHCTPWWTDQTCRAGRGRPHLRRC